MVPLWIGIFLVGVALGMKFSWFNKAIMLLLPALQGWALVSADMMGMLRTPTSTIESLISQTLNNMTHACTMAHEASFKEVIGVTGFYFFLGSLIVYSLFIVLTIVSLFQLFPFQAAIFAALSASFFTIAPWLNGKNHWESHLELSIAFLILCAAAERIREERNEQLSQMEKKVTFLFPLLSFASFIWFSVAKTQK